jgi:hypothetical protein
LIVVSYHAVCHVATVLLLLLLLVRRLGACELPDDDHFCCLEALLMQLGVKEVALPKLGTGKDGAAQADAGARVCNLDHQCSASVLLWDASIHFCPASGGVVPGMLLMQLGVGVVGLPSAGHRQGRRNTGRCRCVCV